MKTEEGETRRLTVAEVAAELALPVHRVKAAVAQLRDRLTWETASTAGRPGHPSRLYGPEAVAAIRRHLEKTRTRKERATHEGAAHWQRLARLRLFTGQLDRLAAALKDLYQELRADPPTVTATVGTLPDPRLLLVHPISVLVSPLRGLLWRASWPEARLFASGRTQGAALRALREEIVRIWLTLREFPQSDPERLQVLAAAIAPRPSRTRERGRSGRQQPPDAEGEKSSEPATETSPSAKPG